MLFISRLIVSVGALLASTRDSSSRPNSGSYAKLVHWGPEALSAARVEGHTPAPIAKVSPSGLVSHLALSRRLFAPPRRPTSTEKPRQIVQHTHDLALSPTSTFATHPNLTRLDNDQSVKSILFTVLPYDGPRELAVYRRPTSLVVYTGSINYVRFWVDPSYYELIVHVHRPRFVIGAYLAKQYSHLDPTSFERWAVENPIDILLSSERSGLLWVFSPASPQYSTIGKIEHRLEERATWMLVYLYTVGFLFALTMMAFEEYMALWKACGCDQSGASAVSSGSNHDLLALPGVVYQVSSEESEPGLGAAEGNWWKSGGADMRSSEYFVSASLLELPVITAPELTFPTDASIPSLPLDSTDAPIPPEGARDKNLPSRARKVLPTPPSGPRFKTAAWRRRRVK